MDIKNEQHPIFPKEITNEQAAGTGMAMVLILLLIGLTTKNFIYFKIDIGVLLLNMTYPMAFYPIAIVWFGLSNIMGTVMTRVILTLLFVVLVVPIAVIRRIAGKDALQLYSWKKGTSSVMRNRNHTFTSLDLKKPY